MFTLSSPAFPYSGDIPAKYTGDGADESPPLEWLNAPDGTQSFALIVDDPDVPDPAAPKRTWVHWVVSDLPASATKLVGGASRRAMPAGSHEGKNDSGDVGYSGPYPPRGKHRYFFKLYALDAPLGARAGETKLELLKAMDGHVLAMAELIGVYERVTGDG